MKRRPTGTQAAALRQRKFSRLQHLSLPAEALPGSLSVSQTRCGKPTCHCRDGEGHPAWSLTFMVEGHKQVLRIPRELVEEVRRRVEEGKAFKEAVAEILACNAQLLGLSIRQSRRRR